MQKSILFATIKKFALASIATAFILFLTTANAACANGDDAIFPDETDNMEIITGADGTVRNGTEYFSYRVEPGFTSAVSVVISKKSGRLDMDVYPAERENQAEYRGRELGSATFSVILRKPGDYKVRVFAKDFVGDYGISLKTEQIAPPENILAAARPFLFPPLRGFATKPWVLPTSLPPRWIFHEAFGSSHQPPSECLLSLLASLREGGGPR